MEIEDTERNGGDGIISGAAIKQQGCETQFSSLRLKLPTSFYGRNVSPFEQNIASRVQKSFRRNLQGFGIL